MAENDHFRDEQKSSKALNLSLLEEQHVGMDKQRLEKIRVHTKKVWSTQKWVHRNREWYRKLEKGVCIMSKSHIHPRTQKTPENYNWIVSDRKITIECLRKRPNYLCIRTPPSRNTTPSSKIFIFIVCW